MKYFLLLGFLAAYSFLIYFFVIILNRSNVAAKNKLMLIKLGLLSIVFISCIFIILQTFSLQTFTLIEFNTDLERRVLVGKHDFMRLTFSWEKILVYLYQAGLAIFLLRIIYSYFAAKKILRHSVVDTIQGQRVLLNHTIQAPLSFGLLKTEIYLPIDAKTKWTTRELEMILVHEKNHIVQQDYVWKIISLVVRSFLFFVPWSFMLHRRFELEMEIYCDEQVCLQTHSNISEYGRFLFKLVSNQHSNFIYSNLTDSSLKWRFLAMKTKTRNNLCLTLFFSILLIICGAAIALANTKINQNSVFDITSKIIIDGKIVTSPRIITRSNQEAMINLSSKAGTEGIKMQLIAKSAATSSNQKGIAINYDVEYKSSDINFQTKQEIYAIENKEKIIQISSQGKHLVELAVLAKKTD